MSGRNSANDRATVAGCRRSTSGLSAQPKTMSSSCAAASRRDRATCPWLPMTNIRMHVSSVNETKSLAVVELLAQRPPPIAVVEVPADGLFDSGFEGFSCTPAKLGFEFAGIDGVTKIVTRTVGH